MMSLLKFAPTLFGGVQKVFGKLQVSSEANPGKSSMSVVIAMALSAVGLSPTMQNSIADVLILIAGALQN